jgi:formamidopyrimidine-DNA glycosylase
MRDTKSFNETSREVKTMEYTYNCEVCGVSVTKENKRGRKSKYCTACADKRKKESMIAFIKKKTGVV